jgi:hypothetical protein
MNDVYEKIELDGKTIEIVNDDCPPNPREDYDHLGTILYLKTSRYILGDEGVDHEVIDEMVERDDVFLLPVYAYIHSGISLSTGSFHGRVPAYHAHFDSGQSGVIYIEKEKMREEFGNMDENELQEKAEKIMRSEIEEFDQYLNGDVWGYCIYDETGEEIDSCYGFYGMDYCIEEAKRVAEYEPA